MGWVVGEGCGRVMRRGARGEGGGAGGGGLRIEQGVHMLGST